MLLNIPKKTLEYIKVYKDTRDYVLVAVRATRKGVIFVRTLFVMSDEKIHKYWMKSALKSYKP